ncbi:hypothetical protein WR25_21607 [Diploscapter pachys]|uniref:Uncharacterized protein n=1 Tax=Diploscapter pachys TaxID=2018661 RepID=A0A2A2M527_9BILA|nr:hypothetical protein WR25_21607 [Diploscapter pachys]
MLTGGSTSLRMFEDDARTAGATARALLCKAAARRWGVTWTDCSAEAGFIVHGRDRLRFAALAAEAVRERVPSPLPVGVAGRWVGQLCGGYPLARYGACRDPAGADR